MASSGVAGTSPTRPGSTTTAGADGTTDPDGTVTIGVDIGGTKIAAGVVTATGEVLARAACVVCLEPNDPGDAVAFARQGYGVVAAITPWNVPTQINLAKVGAALAAGCTVVLKPAPDTPWTATLVGRIVAEETDIPRGVFNVVASADHGVGALLSSDPRVDVVSFTGSTATGRKVMVAAAANLTRVFL